MIVAHCDHCNDDTGKRPTAYQRRIELFTGFETLLSGYYTPAASKTLELCEACWKALLEVLGVTLPDPAPAPVLDPKVQAPKKGWKAWAKKGKAAA